MRHAEGQHTSTSPFRGNDADAPAPAKRPRLTENNRLLHVVLVAQELGAPSIMWDGGLKEMARHYDVPYNALRQLIREDGNLTAKGQDKINREVLPNIDPEARAFSSQSITGRFLQELSTLGREGFQSGGVVTLAEQNNVSADSSLELVR